MINKPHSTDRMCVRYDIVECERFSLRYELIKRKNSDYTLFAEYLYDLMVIKMPHGSHSEESAVIPAVSSMYERAADMYECMCRNTVTPMCVAEFFEDYNSCM